MNTDNIHCQLGETLDKSKGWFLLRKETPTTLNTHLFVVYWPTTRPGCQNRKCTNVNNRCIRSRNIRIITLTVDGLNECNCDTHKKVGVELLHNSVKTGCQLVWRPDQLETRFGRESQHPAEGASGSRLRVWRSDQFVRRCLIEEHVPEQTRKTGKKRGYGQ